MIDELSGRELNRVIAKALGWKAELRRHRGMLWAALMGPDGTLIGKEMPLWGVYANGNPEHAFSQTPDWAHDANAALELCYQWAVEHGKDIMVRPKDDGLCQAVFMRSDYEHFEYWEPFLDIGWHRGKTPAEALARLALAALKLGAVAE